MFKKILVGLDGSQLAEEVIPYVTEQADRFNSQVVLLQVIIEEDAVYPVQGATAPNLSAPTIEPAGPEFTVAVLEETRREHEAVKSYLEKIAQPLRDHGIVTVTEVIASESIARTMLEFARRNNIDLIVLAVCGKGGWKRLFFGSVADEILRESTVPVMVIKPCQPRHAK